MRKEIYLIEGLKEETYDSFSERIMTISKDIVTSHNIHKFKVTYTNTRPPKISIIPFKKKKMAAFSIFKTSEESILSLVNCEGFKGNYLVDEALPVQYNKTWSDLSFTPGICLLTLFKQKEGISQKQFIDTWHNSHTPLSLKIHPLWNYNRNVVRQKLKSTSFPWDGIVEEQFKNSNDLLNPIKFFGNPLVMPYRMWQVYSDTKSFLDYKSIEPYYANEMFIKS